MTANESVLAWGILLALLSGFMNGTFTLPMRYLGRWSWENVWALFIVVSCVVMPGVIATLTISDVLAVLRGTPASAVLIAVATGFAWGFGAIMFGQGVSAIGISMGNTLVLAISASLGSFFPILILDSERLLQPQGKAIMLGTLVGVLGIAACGYAGHLRERSQGEQVQRLRGDMVGQARPFWIGLLLCVGSGLLSAVFNIGYSSAQLVVQAATRLGNSEVGGSNLIWLLMLMSGAVANLGFCSHLFKKNGSWPKYFQPGSLRLGGLAFLMGLLWGGSIFVYGAATAKLGRVGPAIGWPLSLTVGLLVANLWGLLIGEWKQSGPRARTWMAVGLFILVCAIATLGWSGMIA